MTGRGRVLVRVISSIGLASMTWLAVLNVAWSATPSLFPYPVYPAGPTPMDLVAADFNGDGLIDVAAADNGKNFFNESPWGGVSIMLGQVDGSLGARTQFTAGRVAPLAPLAMVAGDFNGDGRLDVALANAPPPPPFGPSGAGGTVSILLGGGDGTLGSQTHFTAGDYPVAIAMGDFNGDGDLDLVAVNNVSNDLSVFLGHGDGSFAAQVRYATAAAPESVTVADFNGDSRADLAVACAQAGLVSVLLGRGDGTFLPASTYGAGAGASAIDAGDLNGDGRIDLAVGNGGAATISILTGLGNGMFVTQGSFAATKAPSSLRILDFNGDDLPDIVETDAPGYPDPGQILVLRGQGNFLFSLVDWLPVGASPCGIAVVDIDHDGESDLLAARREANDVLVVPGRGDGTFGPRPSTVGTGSYPAAIAAADFNGDGLPDLAVANASSNSLSIMLGLGPAVFEPEVRYAAGHWPSGVTVRDLNGDGSMDIAVPNSNSDDISIFDGHGDGTFAPEIRLPAGDGPRDIVGADFDRDGYQDLVVLNWGSKDLSFLRGQIDGTFAPKVRVGLVGGMTPNALAAADFDGNGWPDIAVGGNLGLQILTMFPTGKLTVVTNVPGACWVAGLTPADLDEDGRLDLALRCYATPGPLFQVLPGRGDATFDTPRAFGSADQGSSIVAADFDGDGHLDLGISSQDYAVGIWRGTGHGDFGRTRRFGAGAGGPKIAVADFDSDSKPDFALTNTTITGVWVLLNQNPPNTPPVAAAGPDQRVECTSAQTTLVTLDGRQSADADSSPGTRDDIAAYDWYEDRGLPSEWHLAAGERPTVALTLGSHRITLVVSDWHGATSTDDLMVEVVDTTPPHLTVDVVPGVLWPPNHGIVPVSMSWRVQDLCDPSVRIELMAAVSSEPDDAPDLGDGATVDDIQEAAIGTAASAILLRAERHSSGPGRSYSLTYRATDRASNSTIGITTVAVPLDQGQGPEPLLMRLAPTATGSSTVRIDCPVVQDATGYDVIMGALSALHVANGVLSLGHVSVLARGIAEPSLTEAAGAPVPAEGQGYFYLIQQIVSWGGVGYGTESAPWPRIPDSCEGGCP